jgi:hypothetical protein
MTNITVLSISSNGISQTSASGANVFMGKVGIGTNNPTEKLHVLGNARVDGTSIVSAVTLGGETRTNWPSGGGVATGALMSANNLSDLNNNATARSYLGLGSAATRDVSVFDAAGSAGAVSSTLSAHTANLNNPHQVTASQAGALTPTGSGAQLTGITAAQVGALSTNGGVVNGEVNFNGLVSFASPFGDVPMGVFTNR